MIEKSKPFIITVAIIFFLLIGFIILINDVKSEKNAESLLIKGGNSELKLGNTCFIFNSMEERNDKYIYLTLSPDDTYEVRFYDKKDRVESLIINSGAWAQTINADGSKLIISLIPAYISNKGYYNISITPIRGDGAYSISGFDMLNSIEPEKRRSVNLIDFEIKQFKINVSDEDYKKIEAKRKEALELGILLTEDSDNVDAEIFANGEKFKTALRLKGDWTDHLAGDKWSFRIDLKGDNCIYGLQKFSLQPQETRNGIWEYLIYDMYREQGGVALRYDFADVYVNGTYMGVYALEEFMEKRVIENSQKREGPIIKINEELLWEKWAYYNGGTGTVIPIMQEILTFSEKKTLASPLLSGYAAYAISQMSKFERGEADADDVFDVKLYSKLHAILDLFSAKHGRAWHNIRNYYNPVTGLLEPIPFDELAFSAEAFNFDFDEPIISAIFNSDKHNELYLENLQKFADEYPDFIERHRDLINRFIITIQRDYPEYRFDPSVVKERIEKIRLVENPEEVYYDINGFSADKVIITIINKNPMDIYVQSLMKNGEIIAKYPNLKIGAGESIEVEVPMGKIGSGKGISFEYHILVSNKIYNSAKINTIQKDN